MYLSTEIHRDVVSGQLLYVYDAIAQHGNSVKFVQRLLST